MKKLFKFLIKVLFFAIFLGTIIILNYVKQGYSMYQEALKTKPILEMVEEIENKENYTKIEDVPKIYKDAVIAVEDHRFYMHQGIDFLSIGRAIVTNIKNLDLIEGGSTISQQICKNVYFTQDKQLERKFAEMFMAVKLEKSCNKDKILELYFNTSFYGNGYYTLSEASRGYFDKEPIELSDYEATMLAGVPNAPSLYNPKKSIKLAKQRQKQVLSAMNKFGYLDKNEVEKILNEAIDLSRFEE